MSKQSWGANFEPVPAPFRHGPHFRQERKITPLAMVLDLKSNRDAPNMAAQILTQAVIEERTRTVQVIGEQDTFANGAG